MEILTLREQLPGPSKLEIWHLNCLNHSDLKCLAVCKVASNINVKKNGRTAAAGRAETMWEKRFSEGNQESARP